MPLTTIGAELSRPSPTKLHTVVLVLRSVAVKVALLRKYPRDPLMAGAGLALKVPSTFPFAGSRIKFPLGASRTNSWPFPRTGVLPPPPEQLVLWCQINAPLLGPKSYVCGHE